MAGPVKANAEVKDYWERGACGTDEWITLQEPPRTPAWFAKVEAHRYTVEPFIHAHAKFPLYRGARLLEIGVGAGTDHLQFARSGAICHGVDLTEEAIATTRAHLALFGHESKLKRVDATGLPFKEKQFDIVYSWGVIHHADDPSGILLEVQRVLEAGGEFRGMFYHRFSLVALKLWLRFALLAGRPWRSLTWAVSNHMESPGTKAYSLRGLKRVFAGFSDVQVTPIVTPYDTKFIPAMLHFLIPRRLGWFLAVYARNPTQP